MPDNALILDKHNLVKLLCGVIEVAISDAQSMQENQDVRREAARSWLLSEDFEDMALVAGVDFAAIRKWVQAGCPDPDRQDRRRAGRGGRPTRRIE